MGCGVEEVVEKFLGRSLFGSYFGEENLVWGLGCGVGVRVFVVVLSDIEVLWIVR